MEILLLILAFLAGLFIPSPIDTLIKSWVKAIWNKIFGKQEV